MIPPKKDLIVPPPIPPHERVASIPSPEFARALLEGKVKATFVADGDPVQAVFPVYISQDFEFSQYGAKVTVTFATQDLEGNAVEIYPPQTVHLDKVYGRLTFAAYTLVTMPKPVI